MHERPYDSEDLLQTLLAKDPNLLAGGDQLAGSPRRWLLVKRETGVPDREALVGAESRAVPDIGPAIELTARYQPQSGPMTPPTR
jgi:hypothetical protein